MLLSVAELQPALHDLFNDTARDIAKDTGFCQRERLLTGPTFAQALTFCLLKNPDASLDDLADFCLRHLGLDITPTAFSERFTPTAAAFLFELFLESFNRSFSSLRRKLLPVLRRFNGVFLRDATTVRLPACLAHLLPGRQGRGDEQGASAALKLVLEVEVTTGQFTQAEVLSGTANEKTAALSNSWLPEGSLLLEDMGFLSGQRLQAYDKQGVYVLTHAPYRTAFFVKKRGRFVRLDLLAWLRRQACQAERRVHVFHKEKLAMRLLAVRVPEEMAEQRRRRVREEAKQRGRPVSQRKLELCEWNLLLTNAPREKLSLSEAADVRRVRWQIELVFKVFKSEGGIDKTRAENPWRVLCELFAKLLGQAVQQWLLLAAGYVMLRHSAKRAARRARESAADVLRALPNQEALQQQVNVLAVLLNKRCKVRSRQFQPSTFDRLADRDAEFRQLDQAV